MKQEYLIFEVYLWYTMNIFFYLFPPSLPPWILPLSQINFLETNKQDRTIPKTNLYFSGGNCSVIQKDFSTAGGEWI